MPTYFPIRTDPDIFEHSEQGGMMGAALFGPFVFNNFLFVCLRDIPNYRVHMFKSVDLGATWLLLDGANEPDATEGNGVAYWDGADTVRVVYETGLPPYPVPMQFQNFDLASETWGPVYGAAGAPTSATFSAVWLRPDNTLIVVYDPTLLPGGSHFNVAVFDLTTGLWVTSFDAGTNIVALPGWDATRTSVVTSQSTSVLDAAGVLHVFVYTQSIVLVPIWANLCFYQQIKLDNSLGVFFQFPGQQAPLTGGKQDLVAYSGSPMGRPVIVGNTIVLPTLQTNRNADPFPHEIAALYLGTPVANPVWSTDNTVSIDPEVFVDDTIWPQEHPAMWFDGTTMLAIFPAQTASGQNQQRLRLCQSSDLANPAAGWSALTAYEFDAFTPPLLTAMVLPSVYSIGGQILLASDFISGELQEDQYWLGNFALPAVPLRIVLYGVKEYGPKKDYPVCSDRAALPHVKRAM